MHNLAYEWKLAAVYSAAGVSDCPSKLTVRSSSLAIVPARKNQEFWNDRMAADYLGGDAAPSGRPKAWLLCGNAVSPEEQKLGELLTVLGVSWQTVHAGEMAGL